MQLMLRKRYEGDGVKPGAIFQMIGLAWIRGYLDLRRDD